MVSLEKKRIAGHIMKCFSKGKYFLADRIDLEVRTLENSSGGKWNVDLYLERIGMERPEKPDRAYLDRLVESHLIHIPFEALDLYMGRAEISQNLDVLFEKVVLNKRGGYCFELNKLFQFLLKSLGYDTYPCVCRVQRGEEASRGITHRGNIVRLEGSRFFCDVGFGSAISRGALELVPDVRQKTGTDVLWFEPYGEYWFDLFHLPQDLVNEDGRITRGQAMRELRICIAEAEEQDYEIFNAITSGPNAVFRKMLMVGRMTEDGTLSINADKIFSRVTGNRKIHRQLKDDAELWRVLEENFGIVL